jgi:hypothetical protein
MNTATMKHYIDFASASGFPYMLIDAGWAVADRKGPQDYAALADITRVVPAIDMPELLRYAKEKECSPLAVVALDLGRQVHGSGVSPVRAVGYRRASKSIS